MKRELLLLQDVVGLGRQGEVVSAKAGYIRNFLIPQKKAVMADKQTLKLQERLKAERAKQAEIDRKETEVLAKKIAAEKIEIEVKTDREGKMFGSVTALEIARLIQDKGFEKVQKQHIAIMQPIKTVGTHTIPLRLQEQVEGTIELEIIGDNPLPVKEVVVPTEAAEEEVAEEDKSEQE